jgi:hypothetical protein
LVENASFFSVEPDVITKLLLVHAVHLVHLAVPTHGVSRTSERESVRKPLVFL